MASIGSLPVPLRIAAGIGALEAAGLVGYGISILAFEQGHATAGIAGPGASLAPLVLVALYWIFAALIAVVAWQLVGLRNGARTPYFVIQAFALVVAQPLVVEPATRMIGLFVGAVGILGALALLASTSAFGDRGGA